MGFVQAVKTKLVPVTLSLTTAAAFALGAGYVQYKAVSGVSGSLKSVGSDTMNNEMAFWSEGFRKIYPNVKIEVEGKGSGTAPAALIEGTSHMGPMSRPMNTSELESFRKKFGYDPTAIRTSLDVLAVYVHKDNPIKSLSLQQVDAVFSKTLKSGAAKSAVTWGDLGLTGEWASKPIQMYGRNSASGTYSFFKDHALAKGDYKDNVKEQAGSAAVVQAVANDKFAIGYSGIGYITPGVKALALSDKTEPVAATMENAYNGHYPLARFLLIYINKSPTQALDPVRREFLNFVLSEQGQTEVEKDGYIPLTAKMTSEEMAKLNSGVAAK